MTRFASRAHAVDGFRNSYGRFLRDMVDAGASDDDLREWLRQYIDLADLPPKLADLYATSDRAWTRFLNDIIRGAVG
jgi:hypothetical protein